MVEFKAKTILILGGSFAGVSIAHYLLRHVIPSLPSPYRVVLVNPSGNLFFKISAPRAVVRPDLISPESLMPEIEPAFSKYPRERFQFIQAYAKRLDINAREVHIQATGKNELESTILSYDALVLATGVSTESPIWSPREPKEVTVDSMARVYQSLKDAQDIVVVGGGATGVELAGELGSEFGRRKNITLYSGNQRLLTVLRESAGRDAESYLKDQGVGVVHNVRLLSTSREIKTGKTTLHLDNGNMVIADVFLNTAGGRPNNEFIPAELLNDRGFVRVNGHFRVENAGPRVYSIGSLASYSHGGILDVHDAVAPLGSVMEFDLSEGKSGKDVIFQRNQKEMMVVPVGRSKAIGVIFDVKVPSCVAWFLKGRTYLVHHALPAAEGSSHRKKVKFR